MDEDPCLRIFFSRKTRFTSHLLQLIEMRSRIILFHMGLRLSKHSEVYPIFLTYSAKRGLRMFFLCETKMYF